MASISDPRLRDLCRLAEDAALKQGHELEDWVADGDAEAARRAVCRRCGRSLNVRAGDGMTGIAGAALTRRCS